MPTTTASTSSGAAWIIWMELLFGVASFAVIAYYSRRGGAPRLRFPEKKDCREKERRREG